MLSFEWLLSRYHHLYSVQLFDMPFCVHSIANVTSTVRDNCCFVFSVLCLGVACESAFSALTLLVGRRGKESGW